MSALSLIDGVMPWCSESSQRDLREARAAVAELVDRAQATLERFEDDNDMRDLRAALARCGGAK